MGLLSGAVSCIRFNVLTMPEDLDFSLIPFHAISPGSLLRERCGFVTYEPGAEFQLALGVWGFRVRIDKILLDNTLIQERLKELIQVEEEQVGPPSPQTRRKLRLLAEEELMQHPMPKSKIIECYLTRQTLFVGSTSKGHVGTVIDLLKKIGVEVDYKTPWLDQGLEEGANEFIELREPGQSLWGTQFLRWLLSEPDVLLEPEKGNVKLMNSDGARISLAGPILHEVDRFLDQGAELLSAKILAETFAFQFDGLAYRINGLKIDAYKSLHWIERLESRMEKINQVWEFLDQKFAKAQPELQV